MGGRVVEILRLSLIGDGPCCGVFMSPSGNNHPPYCWKKLLMAMKAILYVCALVLMPQNVHLFPLRCRSLTKSGRFELGNSQFRFPSQVKLADNKGTPFEAIRNTFDSFFERIPRPILLTFAGIGTTIAFFEISKLLMVMSVPLLFTIAAVVGTILSGWVAILIFLGVFVSCFTLFAPALITANIASLAILGVSYAVAAFAIRGIMKVPTTSKYFPGQDTSSRSVDATTLQSMTVKDLKDRLRSKGLPLTGIKQDLIKRLQDSEPKSSPVDDNNVAHKDLSEDDLLAEFDEKISGRSKG